MIQLNDIEKIYKTKTIETLALNRVNLHIEEGEFVSVMGPSGSGKSTLLNIMGLLDRPEKGQVIIDGTPVLKYNDSQLAQLRNQKLGFVFQRFHLINDLNVFDNVEIPLLYRKTPALQRKKLILETLDRVGLSARVKHYPNQLSGGQCQRVAIARAIVGKPRVILADEPTGNLDSAMGKEIITILKELNENFSTTIVMVTHDEKLSKDTNRLIRFFDGKQVN